MAFGPDGYLYIGTGDGGSAGDPGNRAQSLRRLLGKMLRINVNGSLGTPAVHDPEVEPVRRASRAATRSGHAGCAIRGAGRSTGSRGDLWIGDVGQDRYEEIDRSLGQQQAEERWQGHQLRLAGHGGPALLQAVDRLPHDRPEVPGRRVQPQPGLFGHRRLRLSRHGRPGAGRPATCSATTARGRSGRSRGRPSRRPPRRCCCRRRCSSAASARIRRASCTSSTTSAACSTGSTRPEPRRVTGAGQAASGHRQLLDREVDIELDRFADQPATGLERDVPVEPPVLAVDLGLGAEAGLPEPSIPVKKPRNSTSKSTERVTSLTVTSAVTT